MTKTLAVDENNDIYIGNDGNLAIVTGIEATLQACAQAVQAQLGEMILAVDQGMPNFQTIWNGAPNVPQFEGYLRSTILGVENVLEIEDLTITPENGILSYQAQILTSFGSAVLNG